MDGGDGVTESEVRKAPLPACRERGLGVRANVGRLRAACSGFRLATVGLTAALALAVADLAVTLIHLRLGHERILVVLSLIRLDAQLVVDVLDAGYGVEDVLGEPLRLPALDSSRKGYLAILDAHLDTRGVKHAVMSQMLADILLDPGVAALIALWTTAAVRPGHPASGSRVARAASANALTTTGALTPVAARTLVPVAPFAAVAFGRAH